ncbi:MAG: RNA polymerase sigma factor, partial [Terriglobales bacterium]
MSRNSSSSSGVDSTEAPEQAAAGGVRRSRWEGVKALVERLPMGAELTAVLGHPLPLQDAETALMLRFQAGEAACFDQLVGRFQRPLLAFLYRMVHDYSASEELLQETFLRVHLHRGRYRPKAQFNTWLYRIATHLALNHIRDHRRDRFMQPLEADDGERAGFDPPDGAPSAEAALVAASVERERRAR